MKPTISAEDAAELFETTDGGTHGEWTRVANQRIGSSRWMEQHYLVVTNGDGFFGVLYELGLTESQENDLPWEKGMWSTAEPGPIALVRLVPHVVTRTEYRRA